MVSTQGITATRVRGTLGSVLRGRREVIERSLGEVARSARISTAHLSEVERGRKDISTELLLGVAEALELGISEVYGELGRRLGAAQALGPPADWPSDPRGQLRLAARRLPPDALRSVAHYSLFLAFTQAEPAKPRIGFEPPAASLTRPEVNP